MLKTFLISSCLFFGINPPDVNYVVPIWDGLDHKPSVINTVPASLPVATITEPSFEYRAGASVDCTPARREWKHFDENMPQWVNLDTPDPSEIQLKECPHKRHWQFWETAQSTCHAEGERSGTDTPYTLYINGDKTNFKVWTHRNHYFAYESLVDGLMPDVLKARNCATGSISISTLMITPTWDQCPFP